MASRGVQLDAEKTRYLYRAKGWSQRDLADNSGLDPRTVRKAVGGGVCDARTHLLIANALSVLPEEILADDHISELGNVVAQGLPTSDDALSQPRNNSVEVELNWKIIDLRDSTRWSADDRQSQDVVTLWDFYRLRRVQPQVSEITFNYQTWGEEIRCRDKPEGADWSCVPVRPGELYHTRERWELKVPLLDTPGATVDVTPIQLEFVNAFDPPDNSFWQLHVTYPSDIVHLQVLFPNSATPWTVAGFMGEFGSREMRPMPDGPVLSPIGNSASWVISKPEVGSYYKTSWGQS